MEDTLIDSETTRTAVNHDLTEAQALDQLMDTLQQSIADKDATRASSAYVNAEPNKNKHMMKQFKMLSLSLQD